MKIFKGAVLIIMLTALIQSERAYCQHAEDYPEMSFNQSWGLINIPTANLLGHGRFCASLNSAVFSIGLFNYFQLGLIAFNSGSKFYWGNALEVKLIDEEEPWPAFAVGAESVTEDPHLITAQYFNSNYIVASKSIGIFGIGHIGLGTGRFVGTGAVSSRLNGLFFGIEKTFYEGSNNPLTLKLEEDGRDVNFGVEYIFLPGFELNLTVTKLDNWIYQHPAPDNDPTVMLGFSIDGVLSPVPPANDKALKIGGRR
jgi:hypothetical protein